VDFLICIDDTDNLESIGTGKLAQILGRKLEELNLGIMGNITRHQLLIHPDIPYTSHNSSMCFDFETERKNWDKIIQICSDFLDTESAQGSDPGLCVASWDLISEEIVDFGFAAKQIVLKKEDAYNLAKKHNIHLSEHGGTGLGVVGALAGVGLRFSGKDGKFKSLKGTENLDGIYIVKDLYEKSQIECVRTLDGKVADEDDEVDLTVAFKVMLMDKKATLLVYADEDSQNSNITRWKAYDKKFLKKLERQEQTK